MPTPREATVGAGPARPAGRSARQALVLPSSPLPFVAVAPCRQYDSRSSASLLQNTPRTVTLVGAPCGIPASAQAAAVNITIFNIIGAASNGVFSVGIVSPPATAWINYPSTETQRGNAGVVSLTSAGEIIVQINQVAGFADVVVDVNGYYTSNVGASTFEIDSTSSYGIISISTVGIGVEGAGPLAGVQGTAIGGGFGVWGAASAGIGAYGQSNSNIGVKGVSTDLNGVWAESTNQDGLFASGGRDGAFILGVRNGIIGNSTGTGSALYGVAGGSASTTAGSAGGFFVDHSGGPAGLAGAIVGGTMGVIGASRNGAGVLGVIESAGIAVGGISLSAASPFFERSAGWLGWDNATAGFFEGNVIINVSPGGAGDLSVTGNLSKGTGTFKIDHPLDPENKYLYHSFVESPDMMNIYNGIVELDALGEAIVQMPAYFEALNSDFRYQLTSIGRPQPTLFIADEVQDLKFRIAGGKPHAKVSWMVTGIRKDPLANANRVVPEVEKEPKAKGYYLQPAAYKQPIEKSLTKHLAETEKAEAREQAKAQRNDR